MNQSERVQLAGRRRDDGVASDARRRTFEEFVVPMVCTPEDDEDTRNRKILFTRWSFLIAPAGVLWAALYFAFGEPLVALIPLAYAFLTLLNFGALSRLNHFSWFLRGQLLLILVLPAVLQLALGGVVGASMVVLWSLIAVLMAVLFADRREATWWFVAFAVIVLGTLVARPTLTIENNLPPWLVAALFALNVVAVSGIVYAVLLAFVTTRARLRELQAAYLKQDLALRQSEKLATLGTLAAGIAHELNNPAAATRRAAGQLRDALARLEESRIQLNAAAIDARGLDRLMMIEREAQQRGRKIEEMSMLARANMEAAVEAWLDEHDVPAAWEVAPPLVQQGLDPDSLNYLAEEVGSAGLAGALSWLACRYPVTELVHEIGEGSSRISEIVLALKNYSFLDQAPIQEVDVHEGLDNTLVILRSKLKQGILVQRAYCTDMPPVPAYGGELNQVWTSLLDNAADALEGRGTITIRTRAQDGWAVIEIEDDGPGIPETIQRRIFDPFFTTKAPGKGTGLGLSTTHQIVVEKHGGSIGVDSIPGRTRFTVRLPYAGVPTGAGDGRTQS